jgi:hypothetical protein
MVLTMMMMPVEEEDSWLDFDDETQAQGFQAICVTFSLATYPDFCN